jgi:hypothetical protein
MSGSNDTSTIDEKKEENNGNTNNNNQVNIGGFIGAFITGLIGIYIYHKIGSYFVYACTISSSCVLPTDTDKPPYVDGPSTSLNSKPVSIFDGTAKIQFPNDPDNLKYYFIDSLRSKQKKYGATNSWTSHMCLYFLSFYEALFSINYSFIQFMFKTINKFGIPQIIILLLGPLFLGFTLFVLFIINWFYALYTLITSLLIFVSDNGGSIIGELFGYWTIWVLFICIIYWAIFVFPIAIPVCIIMFIVLISFLLYDGRITENNKEFVNGPVGCGDILTGFFENYPRTILFFYCLYVISIFFQYLGGLAGILAIILTIAILYYMDKVMAYAKNPSLDFTQLFKKSSTSGTQAPIKVAATPAPIKVVGRPVAAPAQATAARATKGGGNFDFLKELKKLQK